MDSDVSLRNHIDLLDALHLKRNFLINLYVIFKRIRALKVYNIRLFTKNGVPCYFINTKRKDANKRFDKILDYYFVKDNLLIGTYNPKYFKISFIFLSLFIRYFLKTYKFYETCILSINEVQFRLIKFEKRNATERQIKFLFLYSEHENISWLILYLIRKKFKIPTFCYIHGFPLLSQDKSYFSTILYSKSLITDYKVPNHFFYNRLKKVFKKYCVVSANVSISTFDIYEDTFKKFDQCFDYNKSVIVCLSNHRCMNLNNDLMDIANYLSAIGIPVCIRPHPSLSKSRIQNNKYDVLPTSLELNHINIYLMGISTLFFDLCGTRNNNVFRYIHNNDDNYGIDRNLYYEKDKLIESIRRKYFESK